VALRPQNLGYDNASLTIKQRYSREIRSFPY